MFNVILNWFYNILMYINALFNIILVFFSMALLYTLFGLFIVILQYFYIKFTDIITACLLKFKQYLLKRNN